MRVREASWRKEPNLTKEEEGVTLQARVKREEVVLLAEGTARAQAQSWQKNDTFKKLIRSLSGNAHIQVLIQQVFFATILFDYNSAGCCGASTYKSPASVLRAGLRSLDCIHRWLGASERFWIECGLSRTGLWGAPSDAAKGEKERKSSRSPCHLSSKSGHFEIEKLHY